MRVVAVAATAAAVIANWAAIEPDRLGERMGLPLVCCVVGCGLKTGLRTALFTC